MRQRLQNISRKLAAIEVVWPTLLGGGYNSSISYRIYSSTMRATASIFFIKILTLTYLAFELRLTFRLRFGSC